MQREKSYRLTRYRRHLAWRRYVRLLTIVGGLYIWTAAIFVLLPARYTPNPDWLLIPCVPTFGLLLALPYVYAKTRAPIPPKWHPKPSK